MTSPAVALPWEDSRASEVMQHASTSSSTHTASSAPTTGKRSRSNSTSSQSSADSSSGASSVFSRRGAVALDSSYSDLSSALSLTSCSSVSSSPDLASPQHKYVDSGLERPSKTQKVRLEESACQSQSQSSSSSSSSSSSRLATAVEACNLESTDELTQQVTIQSCEPSSATLATTNNGSKTLLVDGLVDATVQVLSCIWYAPLSSPVCKLLCFHGRDVCSCTEQERTYYFNDSSLQHGKPQVFKQNAPCSMTCGLPLDLFVRETLRRSRTSCSTLQAALLYILRVAHKAREARLNEDESSPFICARRIFLAAVLTSSKFLQDRTYSNKAWSRISGLPVTELGHLERSFLQSIDYFLYVKDDEWQGLNSWLRNGIAARGSHSNGASSTFGGAISRKGLDRTQSEVLPGTSFDRTDAKAILALDCQLPEPSFPDVSAAHVAVANPPPSSHGSMVAAAILGSRHRRNVSNDSTPTICASPASSVHSNTTPTLESKRSTALPLAFPLRRMQPQRYRRKAAVNGGGFRSGRSISSNAVESLRH